MSSDDWDVEFPGSKRSSLVIPSTSKNPAIYSIVVAPLRLLLPHETNSESSDCSDDHNTEHRINEGCWKNSKLLNAVCRGSLDEVERELVNGASINSTCWKSIMTVLQLAVVCGHTDITNFLLEKGANPSIRNRFGQQAIHIAAAKGNLQILHRILVAAPELTNSKVKLELGKEEATDYGQHWFCNFDTVLKKVPKLHEGVTPLHIAAQRLHLECVIELLNQGAKLDILEERGLTALDVVGEERKHYPSKYLTDPSTAPIIVNEFIGRLRQAEMSNSGIYFSPESGSRPLSMATTCLHTAVECHDLELTECLLNEGASQFICNKDGLTPIHLAVTKKQVDQLRMLLEMDKTGQVINARDIYGRTPLFLCIAEEWFLGVILLLEANADVKARANDGDTIIHVAASSQNSQILEKLLTIPECREIINAGNCHHETPLRCAVVKGQTLCVYLLLAAGADVTISPSEDMTLLHLAAENGNKVILEILLDDPRLAKVKNTATKGVKGEKTPLLLAAQCGFVDCVEVLIKAGCDPVKVRDYHGSSALHLAAMNGHCKVVECIVKHDVRSLYEKNVVGCYPLHLAAIYGKEECVKYMLLNGANMAATINDSGEYKDTAFNYIVYNMLHPVSFLENVFDCFLKVNDYPLNNEQCQVTVSYNLLQPLGPEQKQMDVLETLLNCDSYVGLEELLLHPLVETFLYVKWKKLKLLYLVMILLYAIFTILLTSLALFYYVLHTEPTVDHSSVTPCRVTLCVTLIVIIIQEVHQVFRMPKYYVNDLESWIKCLSLLLGIVVLIGHHPAVWLAHASAAAVFLSWLEVLFLFSRWFSSFGIYILMFFTVTKNVIRVLFVFTFVVMGLIFAFMIHYEADQGFGNWWKALIKVVMMVMMLEYDYDTLYQGVRGLDAPSILSRSVFLSFMVLVAIVLTNLLVGLAVSDIATLKKRGRAQQLAKQIDFLSWLEILVYNVIILKICPKKKTIRRFLGTNSSITIEPGKPSHKGSQFIPHHLRQSVIDNIRKRLIEKKEDCLDDVKVVKVNCTESTFSCPSTPLRKRNRSEKVFNFNGVDVEMKNTLDYIVSELAVIKQEIKKKNKIIEANYPL